MSCHIVEIRNAVTAAINADSQINLNAVASFLPLYSLPETSEEIKCTVSPRSTSMQTDTRTSDSQTYTVDVAVAKQVTVIESEVVTLLDLIQQVYRKFRASRLAGYTSAICMATAQEPVYDALRLEKESLFVGAISLSYRISD
jgi:Tfp pilus assembly major pilin PilA